MAKRPSPSPIYLAWEHIVFGMRRPNEWLFAPEAEDAWEQLWRDHVEGTNLAQTDVEDAGLLCSLGWALAEQRQDFRAALTRAQQWFEHPLWQTADETTQQLLLGNVALAQLYLGEEAAALANYGSLLERQRPRSRVPLYIVRGHLYTFSREQPAQERASEGLARLASEVVRRFKGRVRLAQRIVPGQATFGQVAEVLQQTFPHGSESSGAASAIVDDSGGEGARALPVS